MKTLLPALALLSLVQADAAILLTYDFQTQTTANGAVSAGNTVTPTVNYTASAFTAGLGLQGSVPGSDPSFAIAGSSTTGASNTRHMFVRVGGTDSSTEAGAIAANDFYTFTVTPTAGFALNLSSLSFDLARGVGSANIFLRTSLDGFAGTIYSNTTLATGTTLSASGPIDLSGAAYQNITAPFEVRFYFADNSGSTTDNSIVTGRLDNIVLNGDIVAVPEPGTPLLLGAAALTFIRRRRSITHR